MTSRTTAGSALARSLVPVDPFASHERDRWLVRLRGPLGVVALAVFLEVLSQGGFAVPHVESFLILLVAYIAFVDGAVAGMASASLAVAYYGYSISDYGRGFHTTVLPWEDVVIVGSSILVLGGLVGLMRRQLDSSRGGERAARDRLVEVLGSLSSGFLIVEASGAVGFVNDRAPELLDVPGDRPFAGNFWGALQEGLGEDAVERLRRSLTDGEAVLFEARHARTGVWLEVHTHPITSGMAVFLTDTTMRRREREQSHAIRRMQSIAGLTGGIAHRFNNLLTAIQGYGELALNGPGDPASVHSHLGRILTASRTASELVHQLQSYSRQQLLRPRAMSLSEALEELTPRIRERLLPGQTLRLEPGSDPLAVHADAAVLEQIVMGLTAHVVASMGETGSLTISARAVQLGREVQCGAYAMEAGDYAVLEFEDSGPGMDEETRQRIFEPFYAPAVTGTPGGIGLAAVYGSVKQSGGFIDAGGASGDGFTFRVWLPASTRDPQRTHRPSAGQGQAAGATILLVEDDEPILALAQRTLRAAGHTIIPAGDADSALAAAAAHEGPIDLLLTDVVMPGKGGRELARQILRERPGIAVLYTSGYTDERVIRGGIERGVLEPDLAFLPKPFSPAQLTAKVATVLQANVEAVELPLR